MKAKHNKKRNTAFIFEALSREMTKTIVSQDTERRNLIASIVKEHFKKGTQLRKELDLYKMLNESSETDAVLAEKILQEAKKEYDSIDKKDLFNEQTALINSINKKLSKSVFSNFVNSYKHLATISQVFNRDANVRDRVLLERTLVETMTANREETEMKPVDNVVYKTFVKSFNEEYSSHLPDEQKSLLGKYVSSFTDNGVELKTYLNEEIGRLKEAVTASFNLEEISSDEEMTESANKVFELLEGLSEKPVDESVVRDVLNVQSYIKEVES
jgi:uncharacterized membrane-anchored protein YhcB (DUF1043 family)